MSTYLIDHDVVAPHHEQLGIDQTRHPGRQLFAHGYQVTIPLRHTPLNNLGSWKETHGAEYLSKRIRRDISKRIRRDISKNNIDVLSYSI